MKKICAINNCGNVLTPNATNPICPTCRSGLYYWQKKKPTQRLERQRKLKLYGNRLLTFHDKVK